MSCIWNPNQIWVTWQRLALTSKKPTVYIIYKI